MEILITKEDIEDAKKNIKITIDDLKQAATFNVAVSHYYDSDKGMRIHAPTHLDMPQFIHEWQRIDNEYQARGIVHCPPLEYGKAFLFGYVNARAKISSTIDTLIVQLNDMQNMLKVMSMQAGQIQKQKIELNKLKSDIVVLRDRLQLAIKARNG
jgi:hypothetical protein